MDQVTALAEAPEIAWPVIAGIVIEVGSGKYDAGLPRPCFLFDIRPSRPSAAVVAPGVLNSIEPTTVWQAAHGLPMWSAAALANAARPLKPHLPANFRPVYWIEPAPLRLDRHRKTPFPPRAQSVEVSLSQPFIMGAGPTADLWGLVDIRKR